MNKSLFDTIHCSIHDSIRVSVDSCLTLLDVFKFRRICWWFYLFSALHKHRSWVQWLYANYAPNSFSCNAHWTALSAHLHSSHFASGIELWQNHDKRRSPRFRSKHILCHLLHCSFYGSGDNLLLNTISRDDSKHFCHFRYPVRTYARRIKEFFRHVTFSLVDGSVLSMKASVTSSSAFKLCNPITNKMMRWMHFMLIADLSQLHNDLIFKLITRWLAR